MNTDFNRESSLNLKPLDEILISTPPLGRGGVSPNELIPILQKIQKAYGYLPPHILMEMSSRTGIAASQTYGVATFYEQFHLEPHGRHTIRCCRGTACHVRAGTNIINSVQRILAIEPGQTTEDMRFTFETVACLGTCFLAPVMMVDSDYYGHLTANKIKNILEKYT